MRTLYLCGAGNPLGVRLALRVNQARTRWGRIVLLDDEPSKRGQTILGVEIAGPFSLLQEADPDRSEVVNLVARTAAKRSAAHHRIEPYRIPFTALVDPGVDVEGAKLASDITIYHHATVGPHASVDEGSVVFMGGIVGHGAEIGRWCVIAPNGVINARAKLAEGVYVGSNASILPEVRVGAWATISAGSAVMRDVPAGATMLGVPAKIMPALAERPHAGS